MNPSRTGPHQLDSPGNHRRIALIGAGGQLATDLQRLLPNAVPLSHAQMEITDPRSVEEALAAARPEIVINTAAYNLVDRAEDEPERAWAVNAEGPRLLARWCQSHAALLVHISSDYVFGADTSRSQPYTEEEIPGPVNAYGASKLGGEEAVRAECARHLIVRTCGLYGQAATRAKGNFVTNMLRLAGEREQLRVVNDQFCTPSYTVDVATEIVRLIGTDQTGLFHVTNEGATTWYELARETLRLRGIPTPVIPVSSSEYPTKARRPNYSVLDCGKADTATGSSRPTWQAALARFLNSADL